MAVLLPSDERPTSSSRERGPKTQMIDLKGQTVLPGLTDAHAHPLGAALSEYATPFAVLRSYADIQNYIRQQAARRRKASGFSFPKTFPGRLREMRMPTREVLDATPDHPVFYDASYASAVNSYALKMSGITKDTPEPPGSRIVKDSKGEPTGILTGRAASLIKNLPREREFTEQEKVEALERMLKRYAAAGLTSVGDRGVSAGGLRTLQHAQETKSPTCSRRDDRQTPAGPDSRLRLGHEQR